VEARAKAEEEKRQEAAREEQERQEQAQQARHAAEARQAAMVEKRACSLERVAAGLGAFAARANRTSIAPRARRCAGCCTRPRREERRC